LKRHFYVVIIDSPAIAEFADAQRLAVLADTTMLVVQAGRTSNAAVSDALKLIPKERRLGIVLNDSSIDEELAIHRQSKRGYSRRK
jgi:Mrp family chromosome partitioning ATPase